MAKSATSGSNCTSKDTSTSTSITRTSTSACTGTSRRSSCGIFCGPELIAAAAFNPVDYGGLSGPCVTYPAPLSRRHSNMEALINSSNRVFGAHYTK